MVLIFKGVRGQIFSALIATFGGLNMGMILGSTWPSAIMLIDEYSMSFTSEMQKNYFSIFGIGGSIGALPAGKVTRLIGHRNTMILSELFVISGWMFLLMPGVEWKLNTGRVLQGIGIGSLCTVIPTYVGEISQPHIRGSLLSIFHVFFSIGIFYSYLFGLILNANYMSYNMLCGIWTIIHVIGVLFIPESPYFLLSKNSDDEAKKSLDKLRDNEKDDIAQELLNVKSEIEQETRDQKKFLDLFFNRHNCESLWIGICCMFLQQLCGINYIVVNVIYIAKQFNSDISIEVTVMTVGIVQVIVAILTVAIIDNTGRRVLLMISASFMAISMLCISLYFDIETPYAGWASLAYLCIFVSAFSLGFGPVPWIIIGEIFSNEFKPYGTSIATAVNGIMLYVILHYFSIEMSMSIGYSDLFALYFVFCVLGATFVWIFIPETNGKSFSEIQSMLITMATGSIPISSNTV